MGETDASEAEAYLRERNFSARTYQSGGRWWADVASTRGDYVFPKYGVGSTASEAIVSAKRRWVVEQEPLPPLGRRLP